MGTATITAIDRDAGTLTTDGAGWAAQIAANPRVRDTLLAQDPDRFIATMQAWGKAFRDAGMTPE